MAGIVLCPRNINGNIRPSAAGIGAKNVIVQLPIIADADIGGKILIPPKVRGGIGCIAKGGSKIKESKIT